MILKLKVKEVVRRAYIRQKLLKRDSALQSN